MNLGTEFASILLIEFQEIHMEVMIYGIFQRFFTKSL